MVKSDTEAYFYYCDLQRQVNDLVAQLASQSRNNPSYKHIWQVYQKVIDFERNEREITDMLYDTLPQMPSDLSAHYEGAGSSQNILNDRDAILLLEKSSNAYESILRKFEAILISFLFIA